ncbi:hypothetical protein VXS03_08335 [Photobacterium sp. S4TG1]|uniref:hypothetical protein n=1 Tax=Photobacterium sp. S4TG1 TaxID=3114587 RepID=UPI002E1937B4|nr:hypothetical protein [Photobacterium sp. S4TG1]
MIKINNENYSGEINIDSKITGYGKVQGYSWCLSSTSTTVIVEIAEDQSIDSKSLPLVGYGCGGWIYEQPLINNEKDILAIIKTAIALFSKNKMTYFPAVTCSCSDL